MTGQPSLATSKRRSAAFAVPASRRRGDRGNARAVFWEDGSAMKVSVFGLGYVGSVSAASFAADGHEVVGVDINKQKVATVNRGRSPIVEPGLDDLLARAVAEKQLRATTDTAKAVCDTEVSLICVG